MAVANGKRAGRLAAALVPGFQGQRGGKAKKEQHRLLVHAGEEFPVPLAVLLALGSQSSLGKTNIQLSFRARMGSVSMFAILCLDF